MEMFHRKYQRTVTPFNNGIVIYRNGAIDDIPLRHRRAATSLSVIHSFASKNELPQVDISELADFRNLRSLRASAFSYPKNISALSNFPRLHSFSCEDDLDEPIPFTVLPDLREVAVSGRKNVTNFSDAKQLEFVRFGKIGPDVPFLGGLPRLNWLNLGQCFRLTDLSLVAGSRSLEVVDIYGGQQLTSLEAADGGLDKLKDLTIQGCHKLEDLNALRNCHQLNRLELRNCKKLSDVEILKSLDGPIDIIIVDCPRIKEQTLKSLANARSIRYYYYYPSRI